MFENIRLSFQGIFGHKMRSFLTMLGIIIGIAAIIAIVSTIKGTNDQIKDNLIGAGNNLVNVKLSSGGYDISVNEMPEETMSKLPIINGDMINEMKDLEDVKDICAYHDSVLYEGVSYKDNGLTGVKVIGSDNSYLTINSYQVNSGRFFVPDDFSKHRNVCIIDRDTSDSLFEGETPVDKTIIIKGMPFIVVGVVSPEDEAEPVINSIEEYQTIYGDDFYSGTGKVIIPDPCWPDVFAYDQPYQVIVKADSTESISSAGKVVEEYLNSMIDTSSSFGNEMGEEQETVKYKRENTLEKVKALQDISNSTSQQLIWVASISLLVGGIGVMNIMLVSVTERTREIGLKKALGARKKVILGQFLTEAAVLTSIGGIIGVGAGIGLSYFISNVASVPVAISVPAIIVSVGFSMVIGIVFGLLPSVKAANLNPIDALRYE
ncbi:ABC transporter permease [Eubacterium ruminantium]|uniref:ABC transporter permease n=1 Tax=Eubacterium ruminantium TaxID=42322 RepID=UPI001567CA43|nr:ABC transporter permease [Eubacterium ruminantium]